MSTRYRGYIVRSTIPGRLSYLSGEGMSQWPDPGSIENQNIKGWFEVDAIRKSHLRCGVIGKRLPFDADRGTACCVG